MFFDRWMDLLRVLVVGSLGYASVILLLRLSGKRSLAKLNAFDLVVTIALGSTLSSALLSQDVSFAEGAFALAVLVGLQLSVAWLSVRIPLFRRAVRAEPSVLLRDGQVHHDALRRERVTVSEVDQAVRSSGYGGVERIAAVVLETDGSLSVIPQSQAGAGGSIAGIG